jgi:hypothetical protein
VTTPLLQQVKDEISMVTVYPTRNAGNDLASLTAPLHPPQGNRSVEGLLLKLANNVTTLKRHIDLLGSAKDTVDHRHRISETNKTIQVGLPW